jgi:uroporphyrinogen-III synthase
MRALVGRAADTALQEALLERGIECRFVKLLDIETLAPPPDLARRLNAAQAVLLTSANAVASLAAAAPGRDAPVLAVGDATAQAARAAGFARVTSANGDARDLARLARQRSDPRRGALVYLRGVDVAGDLAGMLGEFTFDEAVVYRALPVLELDEAARAALQGADLTLLFSPRSAAGFVSLVRVAGLGDQCRKMALVALSAAVARAADLPWACAYVAQHPSQQGMLGAVDRWLADNRVQ